MSMKPRGAITALIFLVGSASMAIAQNPSPEKEAIHYDQIDGALIYDHDPSTKLGDDVFGTIIADLKNDAPGRCSHGGPVCLEYPNGHVLAFYANTTDHNSDGWSEYALSKNGGKTWKKYNKLKYSYEAYRKDPTKPVWVEEGLVTRNGTVVLILTHVSTSGRKKSGVIRSRDNGSTWTDYEPIDGDFVGLGYPFNRTGCRLRRWITLVLARTIRGPWASSRPGSAPMRTVLDYLEWL